MRKASSFIRIAAFILILLAILVPILTRCVTFDHSAHRTGNGFTWQGQNYISVGSNVKYQTDRLLACTDDNFTVEAVKGDPDHRYLVLSSFLDSMLCVREGCSIPDAGNLNGVWRHTKKITDQKFCAAVSDILNSFQTDFQYETDSMFSHTDSRQMSEISFSFENCPIGIDPYDAYMGTIDGALVFAMQASRKEIEDGKHLFTYNVYRIPETYHEVIGKFWQ